MLELSVRKDGAGSYRTLTEAVQSVPYGSPATIRIGEGIFEEKLFSEKKHLRLIGSGRDATVLRWADGAFRTHADGTPNGTFRSYTAFFGCECVNVSHLTIENTSGIGDGQAVAVLQPTKPCRAGVSGEAGNDSKAVGRWVDDRGGGCAAAAAAAACTSGPTCAS